jgi:hypothetical protein
MFFKREKTKVLNFADQLERLRSLGYQSAPVSGGFRVVKGNLAAVLVEGSGGEPKITDVGIAIGSEVAVLTDLGYQKIFLTPSGRKLPAVADHLKALHAFSEDLRETLGLTSFFNQGLGTTNEKHLYDRVEDRDAGAARLPWQKN